MCSSGIFVTSKSMVLDLFFLGTGLNTKQKKLKFFSSESSVLFIVNRNLFKEFYLIIDSLKFISLLNLKNLPFAISYVEPQSKKKS